MNDIPRLMPWIGGPAHGRGGAAFSPLVSPIDDSVACQMIESDAGVVDAAVEHAHRAYLANREATTAKRVGWLMAAADAIDKIEAELVRSLVRVIGKPRRASTFEARRAGAFIRACAAQLAASQRRSAAARCCREWRRALRLHRAHSLRGRRGDHAVQRSGQSFDPEGRAGARGRQCRGGETVATRRRGGAAHGGRHQASGGARRPVQCRSGRARDGQTPRVASARCRRERHRLDRGGQRIGTRRRSEKIRRRTRLECGQHRLRRCRPRRCGDAYRRRRLRGERSAMHLGAARDRRTRRL